VLENGKLLEFGIKEDQRKALAEFAGRFENPSVFYAFPLVTGYEGLSETRPRTVFVEAGAVTENSTHVYIPKEFAGRGGIPSRFQGEKLDVCIDGQRVSESIPHERVWAWQEVKSQLEGCNFGVGIETEHTRVENIARADRRTGTVEQLPDTETAVTVIGSEEFERPAN
jgi:hypothetical protein